MKIEHFKVEGPCTVKMMNELGNEGWELVFQRADNFHSLVTYFKREIYELTKEQLGACTEKFTAPESVIIAPLPLLDPIKPAPEFKGSGFAIAVKPNRFVKPEKKKIEEKKPKKK